jgi:SOS response associated peptidase (SRAP)
MCNGVVFSSKPIACLVGNILRVRAEEIGDKLTFREALESRRCRVPVNAFYERKRLKKQKQLYAIALSSQRPSPADSKRERPLRPIGSVRNERLLRPKVYPETETSWQDPEQPETSMTVTPTPPFSRE